MRTLETRDADAAHVDGPATLRQQCLRAPNSHAPAPRWRPAPSAAGASAPRGSQSAGQKFAGQLSEEDAGLNPGQNVLLTWCGAKRRRMHSQTKLHTAPPETRSTQCTVSNAHSATQLTRSSSRWRTTKSTMCLRPSPSMAAWSSTGGSQRCTACTCGVPELVQEWRGGGFVGAWECVHVIITHARIHWWN